MSVQYKRDPQPYPNHGMAYGAVIISHNEGIIPAVHQACHGESIVPSVHQGRYRGHGQRHEQQLEALFSHHQHEPSL